MLGSVDYIASVCKSEDESRKIKEALTTSTYGDDFVHAALVVNEKVLFSYEDNDIISNVNSKLSQVVSTSIFTRIQLWYLCIPHLFEYAP